MSENMWNRRPSESKMRNDFLHLDIKAKSLGGVKELFREDQIIYVKYGLATGFLDEKTAYELADELNIVLP